MTINYSWGGGAASLPVERNESVLSWEYTPNAKYRRMSLVAGHPHVSPPCMHSAHWKCCKRRWPEEEAHHTAGGTLADGGAGAGSMACWQPLPGADCTNALCEHLAEVPARWLKRFHRLFFWEPFQFLWIGLLFLWIGAPRASTARSHRVAGGLFGAREWFRVKFG